MTRVSQHHVTLVRRSPTAVGRLLLGVSAMGLPLTLVATRRMGRLGRLCAEVGYGILLARAVIMVAGGAPRRMKRLTALLLYLELLADANGFIAGLWAWVWSPPRSPALAATTGESGRGGSISASWPGRVALAAAAPIYLLHTIRLAIYASPGRGLRAGSAERRATGGGSS
jgi:hypothetical protein